MNSETPDDSMTADTPEASPLDAAPLVDPLRTTPPPWLVYLERGVSIGICLTTGALLLWLVAFMKHPAATQPNAASASQTAPRETTSTATTVNNMSPVQKQKTIVFAIMAGLFLAGVIVLRDARAEVQPRAWLRQSSMPPPTWGLLDCVKPICLLLMVFLLPLVLKQAAGIDLALLTRPTLRRLEVAISIDALGKLIVFPYILLIIAAHGGLRSLPGTAAARIGHTVWTGVRAYLGFIPVFFVLLIITHVTVAVVQQLTGSDTPLAPQAPVQFLTDDANRVWIKSIFVVSVALGAPFLEEIFFRGLLYGALRRHCSWQLAAVASGVFFGLVHGDFIRFGMLAALGIYLAVLRERTRGIAVPILVHALFNSVQLIFLAIEEG